MKESSGDVCMESDQTLATALRGHNRMEMLKKDLGAPAMLVNYHGLKTL